MASRTRTSPPTRSSRTAGTPPQVGPLGRLADLTYRHRLATVLSWVGALLVAVALSMTVGGTFTADYRAPGSDSSKAADLLATQFPAQSGDSVDVVVHAPGDVTAPAVRDRVALVLRQLSHVPHVAAVTDPYAADQAGSIAQDRRTLVARVRLDVVNAPDMPVKDSTRMLDIAKTSSTSDVSVFLGGASIAQAEQGSIGSEGIGLLAATLILLITFGSVVAAGLPILVAVAGLAVASTLTTVVISVVDAPDWSTSLATMMGIGIGIDYTLLMVTRFREWRAVGLDPRAATVATLDTAGRAVMVAGSTVIVSMLGLFAMGLSFMRGAALVTILGVLVVVLASVTLFPALLAYLGRWVDRLRLPLTSRSPMSVATGGHIEPSHHWLAWSRFVEKNRIVAAAAGVLILLLLAAPFLNVRFGFPDAGNDRASTSTRQAYDRQAQAFGPGSNGPLLMLAELPAGSSGTAALDPVATALRSTPGVAAVTPAALSADGSTAVFTVIPTTGPQDARTESLVRTLRDRVVPRAAAGTGLTVHVGGVTAASIDTTHNISKRIPLLIGGVVLLSMLLLLASFRSIAVALKAAAMNLLSVAASYGVVALVLQGGWAGRLVGIDTPTPLPAFVPVLMFAVLFGLSMDYEVFLVSRMREAWLRTQDNHRAILEGLAGTGRVITAAAAIMVAVFAAFIPSPDVVLKVIGIGMASAILIDATVVRMLLVPAVMHLLGRANWWLPQGLGRLVPQLHIEGRPEVHLPAQRSAAARTDDAGLSAAVHS